MAVRVADSLKQQNDLKTFPVAYSEDIWIDKNKGEGEKDYADLQELYNEGALGGSGLPTPESKDKLLVSTENEETSELEWSQVDSNTIGEVPFMGTKEEWEALSLEEKANYKIVNFTDDYTSGGENVDKYSTEEVKTNKVWHDGKPIYRKVAFISNFTTSTYSATSLGINNVDTMVNVEGFLTNSTYANVRTGAEFASGYSVVIVYKSNGDFQTELRGFASGKFTLIAEYTKK